MSRTRLVLIAFAATAALVLSGQAAAATCAPWRSVSLPGNAGAAGAGMLWGVAAHSAGNAMAVGDGGQHAVALRWRADGPWRTVNVPERGQESELSDITRIPGTNDYWAVGSKTSAGETRSHIVRWTGTRWIVVPSPSVSGFATTLRGVTARSATDAWAVGSYSSFSPFSGFTLVLHWNGTRWRIVDSPSPLPPTALEPPVPFDHLNDVHGPLSGSLWTVGDMSYREASDDRWALILRRQPAEWEMFPLPQRSFEDTLESISALSSQDVWTVGWTDSDGGVEPLAFHWNGQSWRETALPTQLEEDVTFLFGVESLSPSKTWAVGGGDALATFAAVVFKWNGTAWSTVDIDAPPFSRLRDVRRVPNSEITWAVGGVANFPNGGGTPVIYRHC